MANYSTSLKTWGSAGSEFPTGYQYQEGEQPVDAWDNFLIDNLISDLKDHLIPLTNERIESGKGSSMPQVAGAEDGTIFAHLGEGTYYGYDSTGPNWRRLLYADGPLLEGSMDVNGNSIKDTTGNLTLDGDVEANQLILEATSTTFDGSHSSVSGQSSDDHHQRYQNSEARTAVDGANVDIQGDSDSVDGYHIHVSDTAPSSPSQDILWVDTS